ncbi:MAG TPA: hypothetical protein VFW65_01195 [Pseudonocardiaceae bacterium]|nr:hypothetical protein [Pseudonocardiaceae bacterium]
MRLGLATAAVCLIGAVLVVVLPGTAAPVTASPASCTVLEITGHTLLVRTLPADTATVAATLNESVNAIGAVGPVGYGLTPGGDVVTFDRTGHDQDLGPVRAFSRIVNAAAGTVVGDRWYVRSGPRLFAIDVDAAGPAYLHVIATVSLHPAPLALDLDDFDVNPASGSIYGVAQPGGGHGVVVRLDLSHGTLTPIGVTTPAGAGYGSASFGPDGALYVRQDDDQGRSIRYRVRLSGGVAELSSGPLLTSADATGCLPAPPPPPPTTTHRPPPPTTTHRPPPPTTTHRQPPPTTTTPPPTSTTPPPTTTTTPPAPIVPQAVVPPPPPTTVPPPPPPPPPAPAALPPPDDPQPNLAANSAPVFTVRKQQRQFGLSTLILVIGGGAAAARMRPGRGSGSNRTQ